MTKKDDKFKSYSFELDDIATNIYPFDAILDGGFAPGSITNIISESGVGKTTIALQLAARLAEAGNAVLYIDSEGSVSKQLLASTGAESLIDKKLYYIRKSTFSEVEEVIDYYLQNIDLKFIFIDSITCLIHDGFVNLNKSKSNDEQKGISITTNNTNYDSRRFGFFMKKYNAIIKQRDICMVIINQYRNKVDMKIGTVLTMASGKTVKYISDVIISIAPLKGTGKYKDFKDIKKLSNGAELELEIIKSNRLAPHKRLPFYLIYGRGISVLYSSIYALIKLGKLTESNNYFTFTNSNSVEIKFHGAEELNSTIWECLDETDINEIKNYYNNEVSNTY